VNILIIFKIIKAFCGGKELQHIVIVAVAYHIYKSFGFIGTAGLLIKCPPQLISRRGNIMKTIQILCRRGVQSTIIFHKNKALFQLRTICSVSVGYTFIKSFYSQLGGKVQVVVVYLLYDLVVHINHIAVAIIADDAAAAAFISGRIPTAVTNSNQSVSVVVVGKLINLLCI